MPNPQSLIINSTYEAPRQHWQQARDGSLSLVEERRTAGYEIFDIRYNTKRTEPLELVNQIRQRVFEWREADYPGITSVTRRLLEHWHERGARHHAYRIPAELKISKKQAAEQGIDLDESTRWIEGLDRIHKTRRVGCCFDLSATPFAPTGNVQML